MVTQFLDYFSKQADDYAKYRPHYPEALFEYLATQVRDCQAAWDCATGNGQVALGLTPYFQQVYATDASEQQISHAFHHDKIKYSVAVAEQVPLENHSIDLITVAAAVHWFINIEKFYHEVKRVSKPGAIIAIWCYRKFNLLPKEEQLDKICRDFLPNVLAKFSDKRIELITDNYQKVFFPFQELKAPVFTMTCQWNMAEFMGFLNTLSAIRKMNAVQSHEPILEFSNRLVKAWGDPERKISLQWPLHIRVGRID